MEIKAQSIGVRLLLLTGRGYILVNSKGLTPWFPFASYPMGENYLLAAARYIELNPVRARMVENPGNYRWSSAAAHMNGHDDTLVRVGPLLDLIEDWGSFLSGDVVKEDMEKLRLHERTGRPLGDEIFMERLEGMVGKILRRQKPGPKKKRGDK